MRKPARPVLRSTALAVAVVAVVAALVWVVITRAGSGVANDDGLDDTGDPGTVGSSTEASGTETPGTRTPTPSEPTTRENPDEKPVQLSANGRGGTVTVSCAGEVARLVGATPSGGYAAEVEDSGPDRVRVDFASDDRRTRIEAACADGAPAFSVEEKN